MRRPQGCGITKEPDKKDVYEDTTVCSHCQFITFVKPFQDPSEVGGFCRMCMKHICARCAALGTCDPFEKKLLRMESRDRFLRTALGG
jgi:hypothetical protein